MPILTAEQIDENKKISSKISEIEKMEFSPMPLKEVRELISTSHLNQSITSIKDKIKEIEVSVFEFEDTKIGKIKENLKKIEAFKAELEKPEAFDPRGYMGPGRTAVKELVKHKMTVLGTAGNA